MKKKANNVQNKVLKQSGDMPLFGGVRCGGMTDVFLKGDWPTIDWDEVEKETKKILRGN